MIVFITIDVREGTSGTSADVPRFGLRIHSVSSAIGSYKKIGVKFDEIAIFCRFTGRFQAKMRKIDYFPYKDL